MRLIIACAVTLLLAGCGSSNIGQSSLFGQTGGSAAQPKLILVTDFTVSSDLLVIDRGFTTRLERKTGLMNFERKQRTLERVNDEIVATIVATLRDAGLDAEPGSEEGLSLSKAAVVMRGSLRPTNPAAKKEEAGIGNGRGGVTAEVTLSGLSGFGKKPLLTFSTDGGGGKPPAGKAAAAANASIAAVLVASKAVPEKLSPDVEAVARRFGRAIGERILVYGKGEGWLDKPKAAPEEAKPEPKPEPKSEQKPEAKSEPKPDAAEAKPAVATAPEAMPAKPRPAQRAAAKPEKPEPVKPPADSAPDSEDTPAGD